MCLLLRLLFPFLLNTSFLSQTLADTQCPIVPSEPTDRRPNKNVFRLVQYNVEWLFVDYYAPMNCPGSSCTWVNQSEALTHMKYVADVVRTLQPDILNLCEVEGCDELNMLISSNYLGDNSYKPYLKQGTDTSTGQNVGILARIDPLVSLYRTEEKMQYPLPGSNCGYTGSPGNTGVSKHYITEYKLYGYPVLVIGLHLLAYPEDPTRCAEREAQAQIIQNVIVQYIAKDYEIVVLGDFNDFDAEVADLNNNVPSSRVLQILKGLNGTYAGKYSLHNAAEGMPQSERWTDWWDENGDLVSSPNEFSMIDHVLMTPFIQTKIINIGVYHGYPEFYGKYNSDHYPVVIDMDPNI
jgi:exonuclease III